MSDYLWDKTGAADPEVARLEALLGDLAHRPRPLELPAVERRARRAPLWQYAAAAVLLLAVLAGALVALRLARPGDPEPVVAATPAPANGPHESAPPHETKPPRDEPAPRVLQARTTPHKARPAARRGVPESASRRARAGSTASATLVAREDPRLRAKEQLVYALRLTGVKLEEVRRKVQGEPDAPAARGRTR